MHVCNSRVKISFWLLFGVQNESRLHTIDRQALWYCYYGLTTVTSQFSVQWAQVPSVPLTELHLARARLVIVQVRGMPPLMHDATSCLISLPLLGIPHDPRVLLDVLGGS